jgi:phosphohistidine phosphatase SixA
MKKLFLLLTLLAASVLPLYAQGGKIFLVRHAERESTDRDSPLSQIGKQRAECLATTLHDAGISAVVTSEFTRTQQTAAPLAAARQLSPAVVNAADPKAAASRARKEAANGNVLVVGHSNTLPALLVEFGVEKAAIGDDEYDWLFVVETGEHPQLLKLHYCPAPPARMKPVGMK